MQKLTGEVQLARLRLVQAESQWTMAKQQARLARQRRRAAKQASRAAKKEARLAGERVARAEAALARLEARLAQLNRPPVEAKPIKMPPDKAAAPPLRKSPARTAVVRPSSVLKIKKTVVRRTKTKPAVSPTDNAATIPGRVLSELESPIEVLPLSEQKPTKQIVKGIEGIVIGETGAAKSPAPAVEINTLQEQPATHSTINIQETL